MSSKLNLTNSRLVKAIKRLCEEDEDFNIHQLYFSKIDMSNESYAKVCNKLGIPNLENRRNQIKKMLCKIGYYSIKDLKNIENRNPHPLPCELLIKKKKIRFEKDSDVPAYNITKLLLNGYEVTIKDNKLYINAFNILNKRSTLNLNRKKKKNRYTIDIQNNVPKISKALVDIFFEKTISEMSVQELKENDGMDDGSLEEIPIQNNGNENENFLNSDPLNDNSLLQIKLSSNEDKHLVNDINIHPSQEQQQKQNQSSTIEDIIGECRNDIMNLSSPTNQEHQNSIPTTTSTQSMSQQQIPLADNSLLVDISDALSEKDKVKFTVHTRTTLPNYTKNDMYVVRQHEEFIWLHDRFEENEDYAGYIIPPCPPRPDFDASREKLQRLGEGEGNMTKEEFKKMKIELEAEYLAQFKKTVAMHEVFLTRLATHPIFRNDQHLKVFLEYDQDLCAKPRSKMNVFGGLVKSLGKTTDELYLGVTVRDVNDFFENELQFLTEYHQHLKEASQRVEKMTNKHKDVADDHQKIASSLMQLSTIEHGNMETFVAKTADIFEKLKNMEARVSSDQDLKLGDTLRYYQRDSHAAKALLVRRLRCLAQYEAANRNLEKARAKNKDVHAAENAQAQACEKFEKMSACGKEELVGFRNRRVQAFKKGLTELAELEIKHAKTQYEFLRQSLLSLESFSVLNKKN